ncbi:hypothetical protein ACJMK2_043065 [Sinanodonta woodiana]|uniref:Laminin G domain-containing protein n=1 Tax=Sinanodonta woodiana TaxID=1069815 RepID=A0ABD3VYL9_SINWO
MVYITWLTGLILFATIPGHTTAVSFYGESSINIPLRDASRSTEVKLEFKTSRPTGLLFLAEGEIDYMIIVLQLGIVELRLDLGGGEASLASVSNIRLDDHAWHQIRIILHEGVITMSVDDQPVHTAQLPEKFYELNIEKGIYLGGIGSNENKFHLMARPFRGCIKRVQYNQYDILALARQVQDPSKIVEISWDCDDVFDARPEDPIHLLSETSYVAFPHLHIKTEGNISFEIKTKSVKGMILFNSGFHEKGEKDFLAIELLYGQVKLTFEKDGERVVAQSDIMINDNSWHIIQVHFKTSQVEFFVDNEKKVSTFTSQTELQAGSHLYLGGLGMRAWTMAVRKGLESVERSSMKASLIGCIRNIIVNSKTFGHIDIVMSRLIDPRCISADSCSAEPCRAGEVCVSKGNGYACQCLMAKCRGDSISEISPDAKSDRGEHEILSVRPLMVREGNSSSITTDNINLIFDMSKYSLRESSIFFHVKTQPKHGYLEKNFGRSRNSNVFTYLDVMLKKIVYVHDGSDTSADDIELEIEILRQSSYSLPQSLQERYDFVLPIIVSPENDPPKIYLGHNGVLHLLQNSKIRITSDILRAEDTDSSPDKLLYIVTYHNPKNGLFEKTEKIAERLSNFTHKDVQERRIWYVHETASDAYVRLQVFDGHLRSNPVDLKIQTTPIKLEVTHNTGLALIRRTNKLILPENLTTTINIPDPSLEIRYSIIQPPRYGVIERQKYADQTWEEVQTFAQHQVNNSVIRYKHTNFGDSVNEDEFSFVVRAKDSVSDQYTFRISLEELVISVDVNSKLTLHQEQFRKLSEINLRIVTNNPQFDSGHISFTIVRPPSLGHFYKISSLEGNKPNFDVIPPLQKDSNFSQSDILDGKIFYKLRRVSFETVEDFVDFSLSASGVTRPLRFKIEYMPDDTDVRFMNNGLENVIEGGQKAIERLDLFIEMDEYDNFKYSVLVPPRHGELQIIDPRSSVVLERNISSFQNKDIRDLKLVYKHDDSENDHDSFMFMAIPVISGQDSHQKEIPEFSGTFQIRMLMRNDNEPVRLVDRVFHVVTNQKKVITIDDLAFTDPDIDYDSDELLYRRKAIVNGDIISSIDKTPIFEFKQKDIRNRKIIFQHSGPPHGRAAIWVTDGQYYSYGLFEVQASDPYIRIISSTGALVKSGSDVQISIKNLSIETNVDIEDKYVHFILIEEPRLGHLEIGDKEVLRFSLADLKENRVYYQHDNTISAFEDHFKFAVIANGTQTEGSFSIQIFTESHQHPPRVINNKVLELSGQNGIIDQSHLLVSHPEVKEDDIDYIVLKLPRHGSIEINGAIAATVESAKFSQADINEGQVIYKLTQPGITNDFFIFDVTNGFQTLRGLEFVIEIIPSVLPLEVKNFTIREGSRKALAPNLFKVKGRFYEGKSFKFVIIDKPQHGIIENVGVRGVALSTFTSEELSKGIIFYDHDDSEALMDTFTVKAQLSEESKESLPETVYISVIGLNDRSPKVIINTGLSVWNGSITLITSENLRAVDPDTLSEGVMYRVSSPTNGHIAMLNNTFRKITNFTQAFIDDGHIVFVHKGGDGEFSFQVTDGYNSDVLRTFHIKAKPLVLQLERNQGLEAYPNTIQPITSDHLFAVTNDINQTRPIIYRLQSKPRFGSVVTMVNDRPMDVSSFTQKEITDRQIFYQQTIQINGWIQSDSFLFEVSTLYATPLEEELFQINISYGNLNEENRKQLMKIEGLTLDEGREAVITKDHLDTTDFVSRLEQLGKVVQIAYMIEDPPKNGILKFRERPVIKGMQFTQDNINANDLKYSHDDSDTVSDSFKLIINIRIQDQRSGGLGREETNFETCFNITVRPVNDQQFKLLTANPSIRVIQGFSVTLTNAVLKTVDQDTAPAYIQYTLIKGPTHGFLAYISSAVEPIKEFSQQDIDDENVIYQHDGSTEADAFYFRVSDGVFMPYYKNFNIYIEPIQLEIIKNNISLLQSESSVYVGIKHLNVSTNGDRGKIFFALKEMPKFGKLFVGEVQVSTFLQTDIDDSSLVYVQEDMNSGSDHFICDIGYAGADVKIRNMNVFIKVEPCVSHGPLRAPAGSQVAVTTLALDASKLSEKTGDNPIYTILQGPCLGKIIRKSHIGRKISKRKAQEYRIGQADDEINEVNQFSHEDIVYTKVFYLANSGIGVYAPTNDNFTYRLTAYNVQPAEGTFVISVLQSENSLATNNPKHNIEPDIPWDPRKPFTQHPVIIKPSLSEDDFNNATPREGEIANPNVTSDSMTLIAIIIPLLLVAILAVVIIFILWRTRRRRHFSPQNKKSPNTRPQISGPFQIQQPHVHIEPQVQQSSTSDEEKSIVEYQNTSNIPITQSLNNCEEDSGDVTTPMLSDQDVKPKIPPRSPDTSRTEVSSTVPNCKVTPLIENEDFDDDDDLTPEPSIKSNDSSDILDWVSSDPDLLQQYQNIPPVLRKNQYWV